MLDDIGPWDFKFGEAPEELFRVEPDGKIVVGDIVLDGWVEVVRRIRATMALSAEDAMAAADTTVGLSYTYSLVGEALAAYAQVLSDE